jgi:hypothetical protein
MRDLNELAARWEAAAEVEALVMCAVPPDGVQPTYWHEMQQIARLRRDALMSAATSLRAAMENSHDNA